MFGWLQPTLLCCDVSTVTTTPDLGKSGRHIRLQKLVTKQNKTKQTKRASQTEKQPSPRVGGGSESPLRLTITPCFCSAGGRQGGHANSTQQVPPPGSGIKPSTFTLKVDRQRQPATWCPCAVSRQSDGEPIRLRIRLGMRCFCAATV